LIFRQLSKTAAPPRSGKVTKFFQFANLIFLAFLIIFPPAARAQTTTAAPQLFNAPPGYVQFNHHTLFQLQSIGNFTGSDRAELATERLQTAWKANSNHDIEAKPKNDSVISTPEGPAIIIDGISILNVSPADTGAANIPDMQLADTWKNAIETAFDAKIKESAPEYVKTVILQSCITAGLGLAVFIIVFYMASRLHARNLWSIYFAIGFYVFHAIVNVYPNLRAVFYDVWTGPFRPLLMLLYVVVPTAAIARIWSIALHVVVPPLPEHISSQDLIRRTNLRRRTLAGIAEVTGAGIVWVFAIVTSLGWYGFNPSALLTSAGLIGVAIGLVAQDAIRDTLAGIYILSDDRYGVGDSIKVGEFEGRVERFNLRMTQIRDMSGRLITLSNRNTTEVANLTARWAQVDFRVGISYYDDIDRAFTVLMDTVKALSEDWPDRFLEEPELLGIESFNDINITLRLTVKTPPGDQSVVSHELRKRIKANFQKEKIAMINEQYKVLNP
jgi:small-conductance mechanosensitive channel